MIETREDKTGKPPPNLQMWKKLRKRRFLWKDGFRKCKQRWKQTGQEFHGVKWLGFVIGAVDTEALAHSGTAAYDAVVQEDGAKQSPKSEYVVDEEEAKKTPKGNAVGGMPAALIGLEKLTADEEARNQEEVGAEIPDPRQISKQKFSEDMAPAEEKGAAPDDSLLAIKNCYRWSRAVEVKAQIQAPVRIQSMRGQIKISHGEKAAVGDALEGEDGTPKSDKPEYIDREPGGQYIRLGVVTETKIRLDHRVPFGAQEQQTVSQSQEDITGQEQHLSQDKSSHEPEKEDSKKGTEATEQGKGFVSDILSKAGDIITATKDKISNTVIGAEERGYEDKEDVKGGAKSSKDAAAQKAGEYKESWTGSVQDAGKTAKEKFEAAKRNMEEKYNAAKTSMTQQISKKEASQAFTICQSKSVQQNFAVPANFQLQHFRQTEQLVNLSSSATVPISQFNLFAFTSGNYVEAERLHLQANQICCILYPGDETEEGKLLQLKQQYTLCSASLQDIIARFKKRCGGKPVWADFSKKVAVQSELREQNCKPIPLNSHTEDIRDGKETSQAHEIHQVLCWKLIEMAALLMLIFMGEYSKEIIEKLLKIKGENWIYYNLQQLCYEREVVEHSPRSQLLEILFHLKSVQLQQNAQAAKAHSCACDFKRKINRQTSMSQRWLTYIPGHDDFA